MNTEKEIKFETVEDMVSYIVNNRHLSDCRWKLLSNYHDEYINKEQGEKWDVLWAALDNEYPSSGEGMKALEAYNKKVQKLRAKRPEKKRIENFYLYHNT